MKLLAIDTATESCSVALLLNGQLLERDLGASRTASERIFEAIDALLLETGWSLQRLDAIAFGRGPGGFTGVRLAASITQGLAFAAGLPALPVSNLRAVAQHAMVEVADCPRVLVCQDARMSEVYWGAFERQHAVAEPVGGEAVSDPAGPHLPPDWADLTVVGAGSGFAVYPALVATWQDRCAQLLPDCQSRAREIALLAAADGLARAVAPELALPVYLRDHVAVPSQP